LADIYFGGWPKSEILLNLTRNLIWRMIDFIKFGRNFTWRVTIFLDFGGNLFRRITEKDKKNRKRQEKYDFKRSSNINMNAKSITNVLSNYSSSMIMSKASKTQ